MAKTIKVRIAVAMGQNGFWNSCGWGGPNNVIHDSELAQIAWDGNEDATGNETTAFVTAEIPIPEETEVEGVVE